MAEIANPHLRHGLSDPGSGEWLGTFVGRKAEVALGRGAAGAAALFVCAYWSIAFVGVVAVLALSALESELFLLLIVSLLPVGCFGDVPDPKNTIGRCKKLLKVGGVLLVCVPNDVLAWNSKVKILGKRSGLRPFQKFSPKLAIPRVFTSNEIHLSHFAPPVLRRLLEQSDLEVIEESLDPYYATTGVKQILHSGYFAFHRLFFGLTQANRYDTIWMMARKVTT